MSVHAMSWVLRNSRATLGTRLVILALADYADEHGGSCWPSVKTISQDTLLSERQVQYALRSLQAMGEIAVEKKGGGRKSTTYRIVMGGVQNLHPLENGRGAVHCTPEVQPIAPDPSVEPPDKPLARKKIPKEVRDGIWDALTDIFGPVTTRTAETLRGKNVTELAEAGATGDEVKKRASRWFLHYESAEPTERAIVRHWDTLPQPPRRRR